MAKMSRLRSLNRPVDQGHARGRLSFASLLVSVVGPTSARAQQIYADPAGSGAIVGAVRWVEGTLMGTFATVAAVVAIAVVGMMMLSGRINWRYGITVVFGCFILFGAGSIVAGIQAAAAGN